MRLSPKSLFTVLTLLILASPSSSHAYDVDTHFYGTYAMARYAGIKHEVAAKIALYAQWPDESPITDPVDVVAALDPRVRRLVHFPGDRIESEFIQQKVLGTTTFTETFPNHPMASEMIMEGMKQGWLMKAATGLHTLEDSFAHAGTTAEAGHAEFGHWPDRPFAVTSHIKYYQMVGTVMKAIVAIRTLLPEQALDCKLIDRSNNDQPNCKRSAILLAKGYTENKLVRSTIEKDVLVDPEYVRTAVQYILERAKSVSHYFEANVDINYWVNQGTYDGKTEVREVLADIVDKMMDLNSKGVEVLNRKKALKDLGMGDGSKEYIIAMGGHRRLVEKAVNRMITGLVPKPFYDPEHPESADKHRVEFEVDKCPIRAKEMEIRIRNMKALIKIFYGINIQFQPNPRPEMSKKAVALAFIRSGTYGGAREWIRQRDMTENEPVMQPSTPDEVLVTMHWDEQEKWDAMAFFFAYPNADKVGSIRERIQEIAAKEKTRDFAHHDNVYYQVPQYLRFYQERGWVKPLLSKEQWYQLRADWQPGQANDKHGSMY